MPHYSPKPQELICKQYTKNKQIESCITCSELNKKDHLIEIYSINKSKSSVEMQYADLGSIFDIFEVVYFTH